MACVIPLAKVIKRKLGDPRLIDLAGRVVGDVKHFYKANPGAEWDLRCIAEVVGGHTLEINVSWERDAQGRVTRLADHGENPRIKDCEGEMYRLLI